MLSRADHAHRLHGRAGIRDADARAHSSRRAMKSRGLYPRAASRPGGAASTRRSTPVHQLADASRDPGGDAGDPAQLRRRRRSSAPSAPTSASSSPMASSCPPPILAAPRLRLPQPPRLAAAALARRRADPARDHGRRRRNRRRADAHGGRARHRPGGARGARCRSTPTTPPANSRTRSPALGAAIDRRALPELAAGRLAFRPQRAEGATYARKIDKSEAAIDWRADAVAVRNHIHGLSPAPGAHCEIDLGATLERVKFLRVEVVEGAGAPGERRRRLDDRRLRRQARSASSRPSVPGKSGDVGRGIRCAARKLARRRAIQIPQRPPRTER